MRAVSLVFVILLSAAVLFAAQATPVPAISQPLVPASAVPGGAAFTLTVNGTGFVSGSKVRWNGSARTTTFVSSSQLKAAITAADIAAAKTVSVTVVSPGALVSNTVFFPVATETAGVGLVQTNYAAGSVPLGIAVADFNSDGRQDMAVANTESNTVSVLLGNGDGTFQAHADYSMPTRPFAVATGDFNHDGKLDLAVANGSADGSADFSILLGNGDGTFQSDLDFPGCGGSSGIAVGDVNGDGKVDVVLGHVDDHGVCDLSVSLGNGDGTFASQITYANFSEWSLVALADFDRDGKLDLLYTDGGSFNLSSDLHLRLGNGDGTFADPVNIATPLVNGPAQVIVPVDLNGDGKLDVITSFIDNSCTSEPCGAMFVMLGNGDGTFQPPTTTDFQGLKFTGLAVADFNGDGKLDAAVGTNAVLLGNGDGTFQAPASNALGVPFTAFADLNGDGRLDLISPDNVNSTVDVFLQSTSASVSLNPTSLSFPAQLVRTTSGSFAVVLTNNGPGPLQISSIIGNGPFGQTNNCGTTVGGGASCTINVTFKPTKAGAATGSISISDNAGDSPQKITLKGVGTVVQLAPASLNFGRQSAGTVSPPKKITVTNKGAAAVNISGVAITGPNPADFAPTNNCGASLAAGASCTVSVTFTPKATGTRKASLAVTDNGGGSPQKAALSGTGT